MYVSYCGCSTMTVIFHLFYYFYFYVFFFLGELAGNGGIDKLENMVNTFLSASSPGGVIFIDEAGQLADTRVNGGSGGIAVVQRLIKYAEDHRKHITFILSGYPDQIKNLMAIDMGLKRYAHTHAHSHICRNKPTNNIFFTLESMYIIIVFDIF